MGELSEKVAIVTGASKGIGAAIARAFAKAGAAVAVNYASSKADADRVVGEIVKDGGKAVAIQADVAKRADVQRLFAETREKLGRPSILVNNAGVYSFAPLEAVTEEDFHRQFKTNVLGAILATQEAVKAFDGAGGSVINFSTISSTNPSPNTLVYSASKSAVDADHAHARYLSSPARAFGSTPSPPARLRPKAWLRSASPPRVRKRWASSSRWGGSAGPTTSRAWRSFLPPTNPPG